MATYTTFDETNDIVESIDRVFASAWSGNTNDLGTIDGFFSSSNQYITNTATSSGAFFMEIYDKPPTGTSADDTAEVQFSIAFGSQTGVGGLDFNDDVGAENISATKAIYSQYRNLVFGGDETQNFTFDGHTPDGIYVINVNRSRYKNALRLGNFNLTLSSSVSNVNPKSITFFLPCLADKADSLLIASALLANNLVAPSSVIPACNSL